MSDALAQPDSACRGAASAEQIELHVRESDRHFWSPQLNVIVRAEDDGSRLTGHFGPNANVWTLFLACYGFVVLSAITGAFLGVSQLVLGESARGLWCIPVALVLIAVIYVAAGIGQRLGHDQVGLLHDFLTEGIGLDESDDSARPDAQWHNERDDRTLPT